MKWRHGEDTPPGFREGRGVVWLLTGQKTLLVCLYPSQKKRLNNQQTQHGNSNTEATRTNKSTADQFRLTATTQPASKQARRWVGTRALLVLFNWLSNAWGWYWLDGVLPKSLAARWWLLVWCLVTPKALLQCRCIVLSFVRLCGVGAGVFARFWLPLCPTMTGSTEFPVRAKRNEKIPMENLDVFFSSSQQDLLLSLLDAAGEGRIWQGERLEVVCCVSVWGGYRRRGRELPGKGAARQLPNVGVAPRRRPKRCQGCPSFRA